MDYPQEELIKSIIDKAKEHGKVKSLLVEVGDLFPVPAESLKRSIIEKTNWDVVIVPKKAVVKCSCGYEGAPLIPEKRKDQALIVCPKCSTFPKIISGKEVSIKHIEVE